MTLSSRARGRDSEREVCSLSPVIEPFEKKEASMIRTVEARSESELKVVLKDGIEHSISIRGLADDKEPAVIFRKSREGKVIAEERS